MRTDSPTTSGKPTEATPLRHKADIELPAGRDGGAAAVASDDDWPHALTTKLRWRTLPLLTFAYGMCMTDRMNVSIAELQMQSELSLSETEFGIATAATLFSMALFQIPFSALIRRAGARRSLAVQALTWGLASTLSGAIDGFAALFIMRLLLGIVLGSGLLQLHGMQA